MMPTIRQTVAVVAVAAGVLAGVTGVARAEVIFVRADATGVNNGSSWDDAFVEVATAIAFARAGDEIHVAAGTYRPDYDSRAREHTGDRSATFQLEVGVTLLGGFPAEGGTLEERSPIDHVTLLSGDLNGDDDADDGDIIENSYHVVTGSGTDATAVLDGFTIRAGNADGGFPDEAGGGMFNFNGSPTVRACIFEDNNAGSDAVEGFGGGVANDTSDPTFTDCEFINNTADLGAGMANAFARPILLNCTFRGNFGFQLGGGMYNDTSRPELTNCTLNNNQSTFGGGIANVADSQPLASKCTFDANVSDFGGGMYNELSAPTYIECTANGNLALNGGGVFNVDGEATLIDCSMNDNIAGDTGAGAYNENALVTFTNCTINGNIAVFHGGGMWNVVDVGSTLTNCTFSGNLALLLGGSILNLDSSPAIANCTFSANEAGGVGGIFNTTGSSPLIENCVLWGNSDNDGEDEDAQIRGESALVRYSCIQGLDVFAGEGNIGEDPLFLDFDGIDDETGTDDDDLRLRPGSPCIDAGDSSAVDVGVVRDALGNPRIVDNPFILDLGLGQGNIVDLGAHEYQADCNTNGLPDDQDILDAVAVDCNDNGVPDVCDLEDGTSEDTDEDGRPDECRRPGDFDEDGDVDLADFIAFELCFRGTQQDPFFDECSIFDFDEDGDVDLSDLVAFQSSMTGSE